MSQTTAGTAQPASLSLEGSIPDDLEPVVVTDRQGRRVQLSVLITFTASACLVCGDDGGEADDPDYLGAAYAVLLGGIRYLNGPQGTGNYCRACRSDPRFAAAPPLPQREQTNDPATAEGDDDAQDSP